MAVQTSKMTNNEIKSRTLYPVRNIDQQIAKSQTKIVKNRIKEEKLKGNLLIYKNQKEIATQIVDAFQDREVVNVMVLAQMQSGKTGTILSFVIQYMSSNLIFIENIFIISGVNDTAWKEQTQERVIEERLKERVFHRPDIMKLIEELKNKTNVLIIIDEHHSASLKEQTIDKMFRSAGLTKEILYKNDIKIVEFSATPNGTIYDLYDWGSASVKIMADPGDGYVGVKKMLKDGRIRECKELNNKTIREIKNVVNNEFEEPRYHLIRTKVGFGQDDVISDFEKIFGREYNYLKHDKENGNDDINAILSTKPTKHTLIFIKEKLRCAKTLKQQNIGIMYDRYTKNPDDSVYVQSFVGRASGYEHNNSIICYSNIKSNENYIKQWDSGFDKTIPWKSNTTIIKSGMTCSKNTYKESTSFGVGSRKKIVREDKQNYIVKIFQSYPDVKTFFKKNKRAIYPPDFSSTQLERKRGPQNKKSNKDGIFTSAIRFQGKGEKMLESKLKALIDKRDARLVTTKEYYRVYPVYADNTDELRFYFIYIDFSN